MEADLHRQSGHAIAHRRRQAGSWIGTPLPGPQEFCYLWPGSKEGRALKIQEHFYPAMAAFWIALMAFFLP